jgi:hypothetical protein
MSLLFLTSDAFSQDMEIGIKAGINFANQPTSTSMPVSRDFLVGFHGGGYFSKTFTKHSGFQLEALYSVQGHQERSDALGLDLFFRINYINIPMLYKYKLSEKISLHAGPQFGIQVRATNTVTPSGSSPSSIDATDQYHAFDWGIAAGGTVELANNFNLTLRYTQGITNYNKDDSNYTAVNTNIQVSAGYRLPLFK